MLFKSFDVVAEGFTIAKGVQLKTGEVALLEKNTDDFGFYPAIAEVMEDYQASITWYTEEFQDSEDEVWIEPFGSLLEELSNRSNT